MSFVCFSVAFLTPCAAAENAKAGASLKISHTPKEPKTGDKVVITVKGEAAGKPGDFVLQYQIVEPGKYIARDDPAFAEQVRATFGASSQIALTVVPSKISGVGAQFDAGTASVVV